MIIATRNKGKTREFEAIIQKVFPGITVQNLGDLADVPEVVEDGETFEHNARKKALEVSLFTGKTTLSDDSGLEILALGGAPGVYSARWAVRAPGETRPQDELNNLKLVEEVEKLAPDSRQAQYVAVLCLCVADDDSGREILARIGPKAGEMEPVDGRQVIEFRAEFKGRLQPVARGDGGFGYDPYFVLDDGRTMAELSLEEKNRISHRAQALEKLYRWSTS